MNPTLLALLKQVPNKPDSMAYVQLKAEGLALQAIGRLAEDPLKPVAVTVGDGRQGNPSPVTVALLDLLRQALEPKGYTVYLELHTTTKEPNPLNIKKEVVTIK